MDVLLKLRESAGTKQFFDENQRNYDFYRCFSCGKLLTRDDELEAFAIATEGHMCICSCGSRKYSPTWPSSKSEWNSATVQRYKRRCILAREIAPRVLKYTPWLFPVVNAILIRTDRSRKVPTAARPMEAKR